MRAALTANELIAFRTRPQATKWYLAVHRPEVLFSSKIAATPDTYPASAVTIDDLFNAGDATLTSAHQTAWIGTTAGASDEGKIRIRLPADPAASLIYIAESGSGLNRYTAGKYISIVDEFYPWAKHLNFNTATSQWRMDYNLPYDAQLENYGPNIIMGPPQAGFMVGVFTPGFTTCFVGTSTQFISATASSATWHLPGPWSITGFGTENDPVEYEFTNNYPGGSYFALAVEDSTGTSAISRRLIYTFADRTGPARVTFANITGGLKNEGYRATIKAYAGADTTQFPDGAEVLIFEESSYAGMASTIGGNYPFRSNVVMRGWITDDTLTVNPFSGDVTFKVETINGLLKKMDAYSLFLTHTNAPSNLTPWLGESHLTGTSEWVAADDLSIDRTALHWGKHRTTISEITDMYLASGVLMTEQVSFQELPRGPLWSQIKSNYGDKGSKGLVAADLHSSIWCAEDAQISGGSAGLPNALTIKKGDRADILMSQHPHHEKSSRAELGGVKFHQATSSWRGESHDHLAYIAESPGGVTGYFGKQQKHTRGMIVPSQQVLTTWVGNWRAKLNNPFPIITVPLAGNVKLDAVPQSRVQMSLSPTENVRGLDWNNKQFFPHTLTLDYNTEVGAVKSTIQMEAIVDGKGGSAITFPPYPESTPTEEPNDQPDQDQEIPPPTMGGGTGTAFVFLSNVLAKTSDLSATSPVWTDITDIITGTSYDFILDPWNPTGRGFAITSTGVWRIDDLDSTPTATQVLTNATASAMSDEGSHFKWSAKIQGSINFEDYIVCFDEQNLPNSDRAIYCFYSYDAGATWNIGTVVINKPIAGASDVVRGGFDVVPWEINGQIMIYCAYYHQSNLNDRYRVAKSTDGGATWALTGLNITISGGPAYPTCLNTPYNNNEDGNEAWVSFIHSTTSRSKTYKTTDGFASEVTITLPGVSYPSTSVKRLGIEIYVPNNDQVSFWQTGNQLFASSDGLNFTEITYTGYVPATHGNVAGAGGFPNLSGRYYIVTDTRYVFYSSDGGNSWTEATGNLRSVITVDNPLYDVVETGVIVPNWLE